MKPYIFLLSLFFLSCSFGEKTIQYTSNPQQIELPSASLEEAGFDRDSIESLIYAISTTPHKDYRGLVVIKDNHIVIEEYFSTFWRNTVHDIRSAGKSVTALLLGIAINEGLIESLDRDVYSLFSEKKNPSINEDYKKITLRHLLDMSSGLDADTDNAESIGFAGKWIAKDDWKAYALNVPLKSAPGENWVYADLNALLIGLVIEEASGMSLRDYAQQKLFDPLGIKQVYWYTNAANQTGAAGNLYLTTLDFAKLGMLVVNEGRWEGKQMIHSDYIQALINGKNYSVFHWFNLADTYGMMWYKASRNFEGKDTDYVFASGNGGNQLIVFPKEKMVIALTASAYGQGYAHGRSNAIMHKVITAMND